MTYMKLGNVLPFPGVQPDKAQALKVLEEAAEVFGAWQIVKAEIDFCSIVDMDIAECQSIEYVMSNLMDEIADTIQACCNLASALGVTDLTPYLARCEERNRERGRYDR